MQKSAHFSGLFYYDRPNITKILIVMKLTIVLFMAFIIQGHSKGTSQTVTISARNVGLEKVFSIVKSQTGYRFFYDTAVLQSVGPVTIDAKNQPLEIFLKEVFNDHPLSFTINNKTILITRKQQQATNNQLNAPELMEEPAPVLLISGVIKGVDNEPIFGATVRVKSTKVGAATNSEGKFTLVQVDDNAILEISSVGYQNIEVPLANFAKRTNFSSPGVKGTWGATGLLQLEISLTLTSSTMEDVEVMVNTGYQQIRPEHSTGAVAKITAKQYESRVNSNFLSGLVNKLPGLMINNDVKFNSLVDGVSSSNNLFNIRGISTISGNQNPLIVLDGYPTELSLDMINPNEIESVTLLKDAAAATVYGVRASNGVIVVERKQAVTGKARFNFRTTTSITPKEDYSRYRWADNVSEINVNYYRELNKNMGSGEWLKNFIFPGTITLPIYSVIAQEAASIITPFQAAKKYAELSSYDNREDYARLFLRNAHTQAYNLTVSGGNPGALYYFTANYNRNTLQQVNSNNGMIQLSGRTSLDLSKRLSLELSTDFTDRNNTSSPIPDINNIHPYERFEDENGTPLSVYTKSLINPYYNEYIMGLGFLDHLYYPLQDINEITDKGRSTSNRITANFDYKLGAGLKLRFGGVYEHQKSQTKHYATERSSQARQYINSYTTLNAQSLPEYNIPIGGFLHQRGSSEGGYTLRAQLNYDKRIKRDHSLNGIIGAEMRESITEGSAAAYFGYDDETLIHRAVDYDYIAVDFRNPYLYTASVSYNALFSQQYASNRYLSAYSNILYSFRNTYSLSGSIRIDQSNLFGTNPKYKYKPLWSLGAAWSLHNEDFIRDIAWIKNLKLRVAHGFNGNVAKNSLPRVIASSMLNGLMLPISTVLTRSSFANSSLRWEQTENTNLGMDFSIFKGISGSLDFYNKKSTDLLSNTTIDPTLGGGPTFINTASILNKGIEFNLQADWISRPGFNWNTGLVVSRNISKTLKVYQSRIISPSGVNDVGYLQGYPVGVLFSYRWAGIDETGMPMVQSEDGKIHRSTDADFSSVMVGNAGSAVRFMGTSLPQYSGGLSNRIDIGNFYIYCMINYYGGFKIQVPGPNPNAVRALEGSSNYWKKPGDELTTDIISLAGFASTFGNMAYNYADIRTVNGDYLTLGDLTASYDFSKFSAVKRAGFSSLELKLQASNIYTIGLNKFNYSMAAGYVKSYVTPTYTIAIFTNF